MKWKANFKKLKEISDDINKLENMDFIKQKLEEFRKQPFHKQGDVEHWLRSALEKAKREGYHQGFKEGQADGFLRQPIVRSGELAGSFSEGCDCKKCDTMVWGNIPI